VSPYEGEPGARVWCHSPDPPYGRREGTVEHIKHLPAGSTVITVKLDHGSAVSLSPTTVHTINAAPPVPGCHYCTAVDKKPDEAGEPGPLEAELRRLTNDD
jgi:hypothetical protein